MDCDAGRGCTISCSGACVARWDIDLNLCETRCLDPLKKVKPLKLGSRFSLSLHGANGRQTRALFEPYLPGELAAALDEFEGRIDLDLPDATIDDLVAHLGQMASGMKTAGA